MFRQNPPGFHTSLTEEVKNIVLSNAPIALTINLTAKLSKLPTETLRGWIRRGEREAKNGESTIFSQLSVEFEHIRAIELIKMLSDVRERLSNWQASWELLRVLAREDFGVEAHEYKDLLECFEKLLQDYKKLKSPSLQGASHGRELDSGSD